MAGLLVAGAIMLQPKVTSFIDKLKARSGEEGHNEHSNASVGGSLSRKKTKTFGGIFKTKSAPVIAPSDVLRTLLLLLIARNLRDRVKESARNVSASSSQAEHGRTSYDRPPPMDDMDEALPGYSRQDPSKETAVGPCQDVKLLWRSLLCQATIRLELFCIEVLPIASQIVKGGKTSRTTTSQDLGTPGPSRTSTLPASLPDSLLPPPDVCVAWAATIAGPGWTQLALSNHPLAVLAEWEFPLAQVASCYAVQNDVPRLRGPEKLETFWTQTTGTHFQPDCPGEDGQDGDVLARGLRVYCPSPSCSFSAYVPLLGRGNARRRLDSDVDGTALDAGTLAATQQGSSSSDHPSTVRHSQRGLAERCWRRKCQDCGQTTDLDTLVGRKFLEDVRLWCEASGRFAASHFEGLLVDEETGEQDALVADVWASQILAPLFSPALSQERQRRIDALQANGTLGSGVPLGQRGSSANSNSLGAAMRTAAVATFATTPYALGESCAWSFDAIADWTTEHTLAVNPMPALAGSLGAELPNEHPFPDQMGGGFSAGGLDFTAENPYEEESAKPAQVQAQEKRERLLTFVNRVLAPYRRLKEDGVPSVEHTIDASSGDDRSRWTNVLLGIRRPVSEMLALTREVGHWAQDGDIVQNGSNEGAKDMQVPLAICSLYTETLNHLKSGRTRSRTTLKREPLDPRTCKQLIASVDTPDEVRLGRLAHELSADGIDTGDSKKTSTLSYVAAMRAHLGIVPRGLLDEIR